MLLAVAVLWVYANYFAPREKSRRYAAEGVFYLRTYASAATEHGIVGIPAGECVHRVNAQAPRGLVKVTDGKYIFEVAPGDLTDDLDLAESIGARDGETQRLLSERAASEQAEAQRLRSHYDEARADGAAALNARISSASIVGAGLTPLNGGSRYIGSQASAPSPSPTFKNVPDRVAVRGSLVEPVEPEAPVAPQNPAPRPAHPPEDPETLLRREAYGVKPAPPAAW